MSYRNVDSDAYKKAYAKKNKNKKKDSKTVKQWTKRSGTRTGPGTVKAAQDKAEKAVVAKAKANRDTTQKIYSAESMFTREKARKNIAKPRSFKDAFDAATKSDKSVFRLKGKSYLTTKGKRADRFDPTKTKAAVVGKDQRQLLKRVKWMEKRKEDGKGYSAKNLAELTKKLEKLNIR
jgi:hypothetical protein